MSEGRLTDEGLIGLVVEHDRLGREAEELGRLTSAHKEMIGAAEVGRRRASSLAEYDRLTTESRAAAELARSEIGGVRAREANLRRRQRGIIGDLAERRDLVGRSRPHPCRPPHEGEARIYLTFAARSTEDPGKEA